MSFNKVSPLTHQFSGQQQASGFQRAQNFGQNSSRNQFLGQFQGNRTHGYDNHFQVETNNGNQMNNNSHQDFQQEVHYLKVIEHLIENIQNSLQQGIILANNYHVSRQINDFLINNTEQARGLIQQSIRLAEQSQNNACSYHERQANQQRTNKLFMLAQIKDQVHQLIQQRMSSFDHNINQQSSRHTMHLTLQAQDLIRDIINQVETNMIGRGIHFNQADFNFHNNNQLNAHTQINIQNYEDNNYERDVFPSIMGHNLESRSYNLGNKDEDMSLVSKVLVYSKYHH